jgi:hypothetical protein
MCPSLKPTVTKGWVQLSKEERIVTMDTKNSSWSDIDWCKLCIHLRSLGVRHFGIFEGTGLKFWRRGHVRWHKPSAEFHENLAVGSNVIGGGHTDRQTDIIVTS